MPGDRLALAIRVGRQIQRLRVAQGARDGLHVPLVLLQHAVLHGKPTIRIDGAFLRHQVAHVPVRGQHLEILTEVLLDRLRLGGRLDDDQVVCHGALNSNH